tara:strand:+ start:3396 stop:3569 length:174 start_codon:yes stop_codon:yes gene_type:complete
MRREGKKTTDPLWSPDKGAESLPVTPLEQKWIEQQNQRRKDAETILQRLRAEKKGDY